MQRRNVNALSSTDAPGQVGSGSSPHHATPRLGRASSRDYTTAPKRSESCSTGMLLIIACLMTVATFLFPTDELQSVEQQALLKEQELEKEVFEWWKHHGEARRPASTGVARTSAEATSAMMRQGSQWVDGEKKLKQKLKVLADKQAAGLELGVPVLTRYLGEDVPAWAGEGVDEVEWHKTVKTKYDEMRQKEKNWKKMMQVLMDRETRG